MANNADSLGNPTRDKLVLSNPLGSYADKDEYQIDNILIFVTIKDGADRKECARRANGMLADIWARQQQAISFAVQSCRQDNPDFWKVHDKAGTSERILCVYGIWIDPDGGPVRYDLGENPDFDFHNYPDLPPFGHDFILVTRSPTGEFQRKPL